MKKRIFPLVGLICLLSLGFAFWSLNRPQPIGGSALSDLQAGMEARFGEEYHGKCLLSSGDLELLEDLSFSYERTDTAPWTPEMPETDGEGVPLSKDGPIALYRCGAHFRRYVLRDGQEVPAAVERYSTFVPAYEDTDLNSRARATLDPTGQEAPLAHLPEAFQDLQGLLARAENAS